MIFKNITLLVLLNVLTTAYALKGYPDAGTPCYTNENCNNACFHGRFEVGKDQNGTNQLACSLSDPRKNEYYCAKCSKPAKEKQRRFIPFGDPPKPPSPSENFRIFCDEVIEHGDYPSCVQHDTDFIDALKRRCENDIKGVFTQEGPETFAEAKKTCKH